MGREHILLPTALLLVLWGIHKGTATPLPLPEAGEVYEQIVLDPWITPLASKAERAGAWEVLERRGGRVTLRLLSEPFSQRTFTWSTIEQGQRVR